MRKTVFWIFGILQFLSLAVIIFLGFGLLNAGAGEAAIGMDTRIILSIIFPLSFLVVEAIIFENRKN